jgi:hypothetical protein
MRVRHLGDAIRRPLGDDLTTVRPSPRTEVDDPIGGLDDVQVVLDHDDGVARFDEAA